MGHSYRPDPGRGDNVRTVLLDVHIVVQDTEGDPPAEYTWLPKTFYTAGYVETWQEATILQGYGNSLLIAGITTILAVFTSAVCGYVFAKKEFAGKNLLFIFVLSTIMVPFFMLFIPSFVLYFKLGLKNTYLGLILPGVFTPFGILITRQFLHSVPNELLDAARADGAGDIRILWHIIIPSADPCCRPSPSFHSWEHSTTSSGPW